MPCQTYSKLVESSDVPFPYGSCPSPQSLPCPIYLCSDPAVLGRALFEMVLTSIHRTFCEVKIGSHIEAESLCLCVGVHM
jgi:hypothetical protein